MKQVAIIIGGVLAAGLLVVVGVIIFAVLFLRIATAPPPQPKFGFGGAWRCFDVFGVEERPLPPANEVWLHYNAWKPKTNEFTRRVFLARLGGADHQLNFRSWISSGDTPMGAQKYTNVEFVYQDTTNGMYLISWDLRGEHDSSFLRFDNQYRLYQLQPYGDASNKLPRLSIQAIEGIKPEH